MEVKLAHQESELVALLKKLPLGHSELVILRERAVQLREGTLKSRGEALLPMMLSSFIFESLVLGSRDNRDRHNVYRWVTSSFPAVSLTTNNTAGPRQMNSLASRLPVPPLD